MASILIGTSAVAQLLQADLPDDSLEILIDEAHAKIEEIVGPLGTDANDLEATRSYRTNVWPPTPYLWLPHRAESITSVTQEDETVDSDDYQIEEEGSLLRRKGTSYLDYRLGYHSWAGDIEVDYERVIEDQDRNLWKVALVDLVRVSSRRMGVASEGLGPFRVTAADSEMEREKILDRIRIREPGGVLA